MTTGAQSNPLDRAAPLLLTTLLVAMTWAMTGLPKMMGGGVPPYFVENFGSTFLSQFPGLTVAFYSIAVLELFAMGLAVVSLLRGEFLPGRAATFLKAALALSVLVFIQLGFGQRLIQGHESAASLYFYATGTLVLWWLVDRWSSPREPERIG